MTKKLEEKDRVRKEYAPAGTRGQKHIAFRCDFENIEWLYQQPNKGRYINNLIRDDRQKRKSESQKE